MTLDVTTDSLEVVLGAAATTRAMQFYTSYSIVDVTLNTIISTKNFGSTNGTTAVTLMPAPSSGKINQLKFCSIYNCDSVEQTVTIRINSSSNLRTVFNTKLLVGEQIQFCIVDGWILFNMDGIQKTSNANIGSSAVKIFNLPNQVGNGTSTNHTSGTDFAYYLGKADRDYQTVTIQLQVVTAPGTITWAEAAIYKGYPTIGSNCTLTRCGFVDVSTGTQHGINATGIKTIVIPINANSGDSPIIAGEELWFVVGIVNIGTTLALRTANLGDNISSGCLQTVTGSLRPSTNASLSFNISTGNFLYGAWFGNQNN